MIWKNKIVLFSIILLSFVHCKKQEIVIDSPTKGNQIKYAKGFELYNYNGFSILKIKKPWPTALHNYIYILKEKNGIIPDSLKQNPIIDIPIKSVIATSTTHLASLEMLNVQDLLIGFPNLSYISSKKIRTRIKQGKVEELGSNLNLNIEKIIDLNPSLLVGYGIDNNNSSLDNLQKSGVQIVLNGDWNEQSPLGKAEWIKFFGALFNKNELANTLFTSVEKSYTKTKSLGQKANYQPTVLSGGMYQDLWYVPEGNSWGSLFIKDANAAYIWKNTKGTGSLSLPFEVVFEKANQADFWIGPGDFISLKNLEQSNPHYANFKAFETKKVYSYSFKKGETGGVLYYELAANRPDLVLKDLVKIFHPELLPDYKLFFLEKLK